jgi:hypothetical protein
MQKREQLLKDKIMLNVLSLPHFLGNLNYSDQFIQDQSKVQTSWEFKNRDANTPFKATLIGEVTNAAYGTLLHGRGNYKMPRTFPVMFFF